MTRAQPLVLKRHRLLLRQLAWSAGFLLPLPLWGATDIAGTSGTCLSSCTISQSAGILSGRNLFHSFTRFGIGNPDTITFAATAATPIDNVFTRVSGGSRSVIAGALRLEAGAGSRNFYLINPAGVTFTMGATVNVPGAFHVTTADSIQFPDGDFYADTSRSSTFSSAAPAAFGFLGNPSGGVRLEQVGMLLPAESSVNAGEIDIENSVLMATAGTLELVAAGGINISNSLINLSGNGSGTLRLRAEDLTVSSSSITVDNLGDTAPGPTRGVGITVDAATLGNTMLTSSAWGAGHAAPIDIDADDSLVLTGNSQIISNAWSAGNAGALRINAGQVRVAGSGGPNTAGIFSAAAAGTGNANRVDITADSVDITHGGRISSDTTTTGSAGTVRVHAGHLSIDGGGLPTGISSETYSRGSAGSVLIDADNITLLNRAMISTGTFSAGHAGRIEIDASQLLIDGDGLISGVFSNALAGTGHAGNIQVDAGHVRIANNGAISSSAFGEGNAGRVAVTATTLSIDGKGVPSGIFSNTQEGTGHAGEVIADVGGHVEIVHGGQISSNSYTPGNAGSVVLNAESIKIDGHGVITGVSSSAYHGTANAGDVTVSARAAIDISRAGRVMSDTATHGSAGTIRIHAEHLNIDGGGMATGVSSETHAGTGNAGNILIDADHIALLNQGMISTSTSAAGHAGLIEVDTENLRIDGQGISSGIFSNAVAGSGNAGRIVITGGANIELSHFGNISSNTSTSGHGGTIQIDANRIMIDAGEGALAGIYNFTGTASGPAGNIEISASTGIEIVNGGQILSNTLGSGRAGNITVTAGDIRIDNQGHALGFTGLFSDAMAGTGNAGDIQIGAASLHITQGGKISSSTYTPGSAGNISLSAGTLEVSGMNSAVFATAIAGSAGQTGSLDIFAHDSITLADGGVFSISNGAQAIDPSTLTPTTLTVRSPRLRIDNAAITALSTDNVAASNIVVLVPDTLHLTSGVISTSANQGNGGSIRVGNSRVVWLDNSGIETSVFGLAGNGGDIHLNAGNLVLATGFIQANTAAANASGGNIALNVDALIASGGMLSVGGTTPYRFEPNAFGYNVIQAAAPDGVSGAIQISSPTIDLSGSLAGMNVRVLDNGGLGRNPCRTGGGSSFARTGRGSLPPSAYGPLYSRVPTSSPLTQVPSRPMVFAAAGCKA